MGKTTFTCLLLTSSLLFGYSTDKPEVHMPGHDEAYAAAFGDASAHYLVKAGQYRSPAQGGVDLRLQCQTYLNEHSSGPYKNLEISEAAITACVAQLENIGE